MSVPQELKYTKDHEWLRRDGSAAVIGITDHAQQQLGDVVFVELPPVGTTLDAGAAFGTVESVKAVSDLFAPVSGEVIEINQSVVDAPETVNADPYGAAWLIKVKPANDAQIDALLNSADYEALLA